MQHIQALLDAKHERDRQGPTWPGAEQQAKPTDDEQTNAPPSSAPGGVSEGAGEANLSHQRGDQGKRGGR